MTLSIVEKSQAKELPNEEAQKVLGYSSMEEFLKVIERRAFHMARMATGNNDTAMDIVQDSMYKLVEKYADRTAQEWKPLFYRILNSKTIDYYRRKAVRDRVFPWSRYTSNGDSDQNVDIVDLTPGRISDTPDEMLMRTQRIDKLTQSVNALPRRQREALMLRCWEGMSTIETAEAMKCSQGSVKTHYSRAMHTLRDLLEDYNYD
ncbi:MAG TPA: RNA polymerase sigma factor [Porticoccaceae bacterium]|jgi:RNA polymerase sigma-70 factor (ECF subfamily)|nr:RNA polymerase sigma factor [Porticoccaceae bacterium]